MMTPERAQHIETLRKINAFALTVPERAAVDYAIAALLTEATADTPMPEPPWSEGPATCTNCGEAAKPHPAYANFVGPFCEGCWDQLREHFTSCPAPSPTVAEAREALILVTDPANGVSAERVLMQIDALIAAARADAQTTQEGKA